MADNAPLLEVRDLKTYFFLDVGIARAVDGISFDLHPGETLGLVGESGCGKSVTSLSILRLIPQPPGKIVEGSIRYKGKSLLDLPEPRMREIRGNRISMIFQEPMTALNPVYTVGDQIAEVFRLHKNMTKKEAREASVKMLESVRIPEPRGRLDEYPYQMSGGMRQRVMIAMAMACDPGILIADEPTTALDVTVQAQILALMDSLRKEKGTGVILITHDLGVVAETADRVAVMYAGQIVEQADALPLFEEPLHPYTQGLLKSIPLLNEDRPRLQVIPGTVPNPLRFPKGCRFHPRCPKRFEDCDKTDVPLLDVKGRKVRCLLYRGEGELHK